MSGGLYADIVTRLPRMQWHSAANGSASCPVHGGSDGSKDRHKSLSVTLAGDGRLLLKCHAKHGCTFKQIVEAVGFQERDCFPDRNEKKTGRQADEIEYAFEYLDQHGELKYRAIRTKQKSFWLERWNGEGWTRGLGGLVAPIPFHLPELYAADRERVVWIVEGEKKVYALERLGLVASCNAAGSEKWMVEWGDHFRGRAVAVLPDHDEAGFKHASLVASSLRPLAGPIRIVELPGLRLKDDVVDWLKRWPNDDDARSALAAVYADTPIYDGTDAQHRCAMLRLHVARALVASCFT